MLDSYLARSWFVESFGDEYGPAIGSCPAADAVHDDEVIMDMNVFFTVHEFYDREPGPESVWRKL